MVDMQCRDLGIQFPVKGGHEVKQHSGIEPAAEGDKVTARRRQRLQGGEEIVPERLRHG
jgi:hypothetical protein